MKDLKQILIDIIEELLVPRTGEFGTHFSEESRKGFGEGVGLAINIAFDHLTNVIGNEQEATKLLLALELKHRGHLKNENSKKD